MSRCHRLLLIALLVMGAACSGDDASPPTQPVATTAAPSTSTPAETANSAVTTTVTSATTSTLAAEPGFPVTVSSDAGDVTLPAPPQRIAALSATHVEMLYAIGAGDRLIAGDLFSNYPPQAASLEQIDSFNLSVEAVVALEPDLVVLSFDPVEAVPALEAVGIPTLLFGTATSLDMTYEQIATLGAATGAIAEAEALIAEMQGDIEAIVSAAGGAGDGVTYYHETDPLSFYTPNSSSFIGQLYALLGMENIADAAPDEFGSGFPQLNPEFIIAADPDVIFLAAFGESAQTVAEREGWDTMTAVADGRVFEIDPDVASRWGPRVVDLLAAIADAVASS